VEGEEHWFRIVSGGGFCCQRCSVVGHVSFQRLWKSREKPMLARLCACQFVFPPAWNNSDPTERIFTKFRI